MIDPKWDAKAPVVPVSADGSLLSHSGWKQDRWEGFAPLEGPLTLLGTERGRSSLIFRWQAEDGRTYPMFATDVVDLILHGRVEAGAAYGTFTASKRGANYGIRLVK